MNDTNVDYQEHKFNAARNHRDCVQKKRNFVPETKKIISLNPSNPPMFYQPIHPFLQQTNHL